MATFRYRWWVWVATTCVVAAVQALVAIILLYVAWAPKSASVANAPLIVSLAMQAAAPTVQPLPVASPVVERSRTQRIEPVIAENKSIKAEAAPARPLALAQDALPSDPPSQANTAEQTQVPQSGETMHARQLWYGQVLALLQKQKRYPRLALQRNEQGVVKVRFVLDRDGRLLTVKLEDSSGYQLLDREALALVQRVSPFPPPPASVTGIHISLEVPIAFQVTQ